MMNLSSFSPSMWARIIHGAISWEQDYNNVDKCYRYRVNYPNGYGVSIIGYPYFNRCPKCWRVILLKDGKLYVEDDGNSYVRWLKSDGEVYDVCDIVSKA